VTSDAAIPIHEDWNVVVRKDWERLHRNLRDGDAEAAGYFLQQSLEKYLKAFLIQRGWKLRKIHVLHELLNEALAHEAALETFRPLCERVSGYYVLDRYPPLAASELTCDMVKAEAEQAARLIRTLFPGEPAATTS
jgi:HEPN domain-containing protein